MRSRLAFLSLAFAVFLLPVVYYGNGGQLEYDYAVAPGVAPGAIQLSFNDPERLRVDGQGQKPVVYQQAGCEKPAMDGNYLLASAHQMAFRLGDYDHSRPLAIDLVLAYSAHLGGTEIDEGLGIAVDPSRNVRVTEYANRTNFPTLNPLQATLGGGSWDAFAAKLGASGPALVYSTYFGESGFDLGYGIALDASGNAYATGSTDRKCGRCEHP